MTRSIWKPWMTCAALFVAAGWPIRADAVPDFLASVPNSATGSCGTCHTSVPDLNVFGLEFQNFFVWNATLAQLDSDGDGFSNGWELQDPAGTWTTGPAGDVAFVTGPGDAALVPNLPVAFEPASLTHMEAAGTNGSEVLLVRNVGGVPFSWTLMADMPWIAPTPDTEVGLDPTIADEVMVQFLTTSFADGDFSANLQLAIAGIDPALIPPVPVSLTVPEAGATTSTLAAAAALWMLGVRGRRAA